MIQDFVFNHISSEHPWKFDPPSKDFFNFFDNFIQTQYDLTTAFSPYSSQYDTDILTKGWFVRSMQDAYPYAFAEFMANWAKEITEQYPDFNIVGEIFRSNPAAVSFWQMGSKYNQRNIYLKSVMEISHDTFFKDGQMYNLHDRMSYDFLYSNVSNLVRFVENHDTDRFFKQEPSDLLAYKQEMTLILTIPGIPQLYYATEVVMSGEKSISDGYVRKYFPGGWPNDSINYFTEEGRKKDPIRAVSFNYIKKNLNYRKGNDIISKGSMIHFYPMSGVYAYQRKYGNQALLVFLNGNNYDHNVQLDQYQEVLQNGIKFKNIMNDEIFYLNESFILKSREALILELQTNSAPLPPDPFVPENKRNKKTKIIIVATSCASGALIIAVIAISAVLIIKYKKKPSPLNEDAVNEVNNQALLNV
ncbi:hypothetical protein M9Y10_005879 [Tritrichomonas musculus]|uniref:Alpha-amylase n=1 Tax=Tritrichomonas musculus TaxID=1915356 RepID=A0ABR2JCR8_9EUKA